MSFSQRLHKVIPAGCHTYSRGDNQFPSNAPQTLKGGRDAYVFDNYGRQYLDYGMGLRSVAIGYAEAEIVEAALDGMLMGNCMTRPSMLELEAAEMLCSLMGTDMVKFTKTGSAATTAAAKLARVATGRELVACAMQPFFSYDDWFIDCTARNAGIPKQKTFMFDSAQALEAVLNKNEYKIACVILEPKDYDLKAIRALCDKHGIILVFDEMITGFRHDWPSVSHHIGVKPDLSCFGKAMANGFSVACVTGKRDIMELGARSDVFLLSTTHGAEMCGLGAFMATVKFMERHNVSAHLRHYRDELMKFLPACMGGQGSAVVEKTLLMQELCKRGVLMPWVAHSYRHGENELAMTKKAVEDSLEAIASGVILEGPRVRPVFA